MFTHQGDSLFTGMHKQVPILFMYPFIIDYDHEDNSFLYKLRLISQGLVPMYLKNTVCFQKNIRVYYILLLDQIVLNTEI